MKPYLYTVSLLIIGGLGYFVFTYCTDSIPDTQNTAEVGERSLYTDPSYVLETTNTHFASGLALAKQSNFTGAIEYLEKSKQGMTTGRELSIIDFQIALNEFDIDRTRGIQSLVRVSKNEAYPDRDRAKALEYAFLLYRKYKDEAILQTLAKELNIVWDTEKNVSLACMKASYQLYPLPNSTIYLIRDMIEKTDKKEEKLAIYLEYKTDIEAGILYMKSNPHEYTEATSALLSLANLQATLYKNSGLLEKEVVEKSYQDLIAFDYEIQFPINLQYTLLSYADFLASIGDFAGAQRILLELSKMGLSPTLEESIPKTKNYTSLRTMSGVTDPGSVRIIQTIGSALEEK